VIVFCVVAVVVVEFSPSGEREAIFLYSEGVINDEMTNKLNEHYNHM
jgi:hypothetical protein